MSGLSLPVVVALTILVSALVQLWLAIGNYRSQKRKTGLPTAPAAGLSFAEHRRLSEELSAMRRRLSDLEQRMVRAPLPRVEAPPAPIAIDPAYEIASRLARQGADVDELVRTCGLGRAEAELTTRLHRPQSDATAARERLHAPTTAPRAAPARRRASYIA